MRKTKTVAVMVLLAGLFLWGCGDNQSGDSEMEVEAAETHRYYIRNKPLRMNKISVT